MLLDQMAFDHYDAVFVALAADSDDKKIALWRDIFALEIYRFAHADARVDDDFYDQAVAMRKGAKLA